MLSGLQPDQAQNLSTLKAIHEGLEIEEDFEAWLPRVRFFHPAGSGGLAVAADIGDPGLWWVHQYNPGAMLKLSTFRELMKLAAVLGCRILAVHAELELIKRLMLRMGFQQIDEEIFAIRCQ